MEQHVALQNLPAEVAEFDWAVAYPELDMDTVRSYEKVLLRWIYERTKERVDLLLYFEQHPEERAEEIEKCRKDKLHLISRWFWCQEPRISTRFKLDSTIPLVPVGKQVALIDWLQDHVNRGESGSIAKSREQGASWITCAYATCDFLTAKGDFTGFGSRKLDYADQKGNMDSLLEKIRFVIRNLPAWMIDAFLGDKYSDNWCLLQNGRTGSTITAEGGDKIGRGGRRSKYFVDEYAFIEHLDQVEAALFSVSPSIFRLSTPNGFGNKFFEWVTTAGHDVFYMHWRDNPFCDDQWKADQCKRLKHDPVLIAQEIEIDFGSSVSNLVCPVEWVREAVEFDWRKYGYLEEDYSKSLQPRTAGLDVAGAGSAQNALTTRDGFALRNVYTASGSEDTPATANWAHGIVTELRIPLLAFDCIGVGSGIGGTLYRIESRPYQYVEVNGSSTPVDGYVGDRIRAKDFFLNLRAQLWWNFRTRLLKTHNVMQGVDRYPLDELISLPQNDELLKQLSMPTFSFTSSGKMKIESKDDMQKRGIKSPDIADSAVYAFGTDVFVRIPVLAEGFGDEIDREIEENPEAQFSSRRELKERIPQRRDVSEARAQLRRRRAYAFRR